MLNSEREREILNILKTDGFASVKGLCKTLFASESSIRRDLKSLEKRGLIKRSYGGATPVTNFSGIVSFGSRAHENVAEKREIAQKAARLIKENSIIFLDQSSTAFYLASEIADKSSLTVVTNNIEIMMLLSNSGIKLISSGGMLSGENRNCLINGDAQRTFENIFADIAFFSVKAVSDDGVVTDCSYDEINVRRAMLKNAECRVLLSDSSKFGARAPFKQCTLADVDYLISEGDSAQRFCGIQNEIGLL